MFALTAVLAALSITLAGCAGPAKETASSAAQGQAASSAASQTEETGGETESLLFCLQAALGSGVLCFGFGYLAARKKYKKD